MKKLLVIGGLVLAVFIAAIAETSAQTSAQTIYACYVNKGGAMRHVIGPGKCKSTETEISWNRTGPQGPEGVSFDLSTLYTNQGYSTDRVQCNGDDVALSCGAQCLNANILGLISVYQFGLVSSSESSRIANYSDLQPGLCHVDCYNASSEVVTTAWIQVLCMPRP